jgi:hypothetical protein
VVNPSTLNAVAKELAETFLAFFPDAIITSGIRSIQSQASAMASNVVLNPSWIRETYLSSPASVACQAAVDGMFKLETPSQDEVAAALVNALSVFDAANLRRLSWHTSGDAFDVMPVAGEEGGQMKDKLASLVRERIACGGQGKFLTTEAGLVRWHVQVA